MNVFMIYASMRSLMLIDFNDYGRKLLIEMYLTTQTLRTLQEDFWLGNKNTFQRQRTFNRFSSFT